MKEKTTTNDTEGHHHNKVDLAEHKPFITPAINSTIPVSLSAPIQQQKNKSDNLPLVASTTSANTSTNTSSSSKALLSPASSSSSNNNNNFDDDYNEWDIGIGNLIIDLDADIERQSEQQTTSGSAKPSNNINSENKSRNDSEAQKNSKKSDSSTNSISGMSSNFKLNRLGPAGLVAAPAANSTSASQNASNVGAAPGCNSNSSAATTSSVASTTPVSASSPTNPTSSSGATSTNGAGNNGHVNRHSHSNSPRNNYSVSSSPSASQTTPKTLNSSLIEHHAKSLKMKIKRKNIGGKISEINHEIVSSDAASPQKTYVSSIDQSHNSSANSSNNNSSKNNTSTNSMVPAHISVTANSTINTVDSTIATIPAVIPLNSADSEDTSNNVTVQDSSQFSSSASKSTKHSNKNKNGHKEKRDKIRPDKEKLNFSTNLPVQASNDSKDESVSSTLNNSLSNAVLKYTNSAVISLNRPDELNTKKPKPEKIDDHISDQVDAGTMTSIATITEPDCLGPCEPGTSVTLEGIVWQETENGVLVVNVTWRGKTYVGTLLDCTKHDWAPPRFCESPTSDIESKSLKNTRGKRARNNFISENSIDTRSVTSKLRNGKGRRTANSGYVPTSPANKNDPVLNTKRKGRPSELELNTSEDGGKRTKLSKMEGCDIQPNSPVLIECPEPNCSKKYRHINGLKYHQSHAHFGSTFNVNDSQEFIDNVTSTTSETTLNKGDVSDSDNNDSSNVLDSPLKNQIDKIPNSDLKQIDENVDTEPNTQATELSKKILKNDANDEPSLVSENTENYSCNNNSKLSLLSKNEFIETSSEKKEIISDENISKSDENVSESDKNEIKSENTQQLSSEMENVVSPAYSDISDDNSSNENNSNQVVSSAPIEKSNDSFMDPSKKINNNFKMSPLPPYFNKSPFLIPNHQSTDPHKSNDLKLNETSEKTDTVPVPMEQSRHHPQAPYPPYSSSSIYRFGSPSGETPFKPSHNTNPVESHFTSKSVENEQNINDVNKDNPEYNNRTSQQQQQQPIVELQNLKNRIQYTFDQSSLYEIPQVAKQQQQPPPQPPPPPPPPPPKFPLDSTEIRDIKSKDNKSKYSPSQSKKPTKDKEENKDKLNKHEEGIKPTMESTGPPSITNGFYYNPPFMPHSFPFDPIFRANSMNPVVMGPNPYGPSGSPFLHSQMRFPHMNPLDSLAMPPNPNVSRPSTTAPPPPPLPPHSSSSNMKGAHAIYNHNNSKILSPTSSSACIPPPLSSPSHVSLPSTYKTSSSSHHHKPDPFTNSMGNHAGIPPVSCPPPDQQRQPPIPTSNSSPMHPPPPRHPLHSSAIGYPIFDPYSAMLVNSVQANSVHQFAPK